MSEQGSLSMERMFQLAPVSRAGFYRSLQEWHPVEEEMSVRDAIQHIAWRIAGQSRMAAALVALTSFWCLFASLVLIRMLQINP